MIEEWEIEEYFFLKFLLGLLQTNMPKHYFSNCGMHTINGTSTIVYVYEALINIAHTKKGKNFKK